MVQPFIYIVLVNYNKWLDTLECLESIFKLEYSLFKVIVIDNGSQNDSYDKIKAWANGEISLDLSNTFYNLTGIDNYLVSKPIPFSEVRLPLRESQSSNEILEKLTLIKSEINLGFAGGNNLATKLVLTQPLSDFIWYLNNDTVVEKRSLNHIVLFLKSIAIHKKQIGIIGTKLLFYNKPAQLQGIGGEYNKWLGITKHVFENCPEAALPTAVSNGHFKIDYPIGASMLVKRAFLEDVGLMSEEYFLYFEELDWVERGKKKEWEIAFFTGCRIYHKESSSIGNTNSHKSRLADFYGLRNRLLITKKFYPAYLPFVYLSFVLVIFKRLKRKQFNRVGMIFKILLNPQKTI